MNRPAIEVSKVFPEKSVKGGRAILKNDVIQNLFHWVLGPSGIYASPFWKKQSRKITLTVLSGRTL